MQEKSFQSKKIYLIQFLCRNCVVKIKLTPSNSLPDDNFETDRAKRVHAPLSVCGDRVTVSVVGTYDSHLRVSVKLHIVALLVWSSAWCDDKMGF